MGCGRLSDSGALRPARRAKSASLSSLEDSCLYQILTALYTPEDDLPVAVHLTDRGRVDGCCGSVLDNP